MNHSPQFENLKQRYKMNYITVSQLIRWVQLNKKNPKIGITETEFEEITGTKIG